MPLSKQDPHLLNPASLLHSLTLASSKYLPATPEINKGVILYAAVNLEKNAQTMRLLSEVFDRLSRDGDLPLSSDVRDRLGVLMADFTTAQHVMELYSRKIRAEIASLPESFRADMTADECSDVVGAIADLTVSNSGLALALVDSDYRHFNL